MTDTQPSGADLARAALAAARAAAKTRPVEPSRKTRRNTRTSDRRPGDPMGLGAAISTMMTERGWEPPEAGGSILDQWPSIAPELADKVAAVRFEHDTGTLHLRPASPAYATQLRLFQAQTLRRIQDKTGSRTVRALRILAPGTAPDATTDGTEGLAAPTQPAPEAPVRTREDGCPGYQAALDAALTHKPDRQPTDPYVLEAMARQEAALRAGRPATTRHPDDTASDVPAGPAPGSVEGSLARARAYARKTRAGRAPRQAFDLA